MLRHTQHSAEGCHTTALVRLLVRWLISQAAGEAGVVELHPGQLEVGHLFRNRACLGFEKSDIGVGKCRR